jgi:hypothetical protein
MALFDFLIKRSAEKAVDEFFQSEKFDALLRNGIDEVLRKNPVIRFIKSMQLEMLRVDPGMDRKRAWDTARAALSEFVDSEKIAFGDPNYDWSRAGAITLIHEMEIDHWEPA